MANVNESRAGFEIFNARFLSPGNVGQNFVSSPFLDAIVAPNHTAVLGPRGSGKTTLLKMLTLPALLNWTDPTRDTLAQSLQYLAIYIPSSLLWNADYRGFSANKMPADLSNLISISLFRHNVLFSLIDTWISASDPSLLESNGLGRFFLPIRPDNEAAVVRELAERWELTTSVSTTGGLRKAIADRLRLLQRLAVVASFTNPPLAGILEQHQFLTAHFLDDCAAFADVLFNIYDFNHKFALCFDEVEIAPTAIAQAILQMPRSIDPRFFVKFSAAPYVGAILDRGISPSQRQDYKFVLLSSFSSREVRRFSEALFQSLCRKHEIENTADEIVGTSLVDDAVAGRQQSAIGRYRNDGAYQKRFETLYNSDSTFAEYADRNGIRIDDLSQGTENERAAAVRKIIWPVLIREEFLFRQEKKYHAKQQRRLRTTGRISDIYTGSASLFAICEGNPRQIIGLVEPMIRMFRNQLEKDGGRVRRSFQKASVERTIAAYFALVSTVPTSPGAEGVRSLVDVISRVGVYFRDSVLGDAFNPDPVLSFVIDEKLSGQLKELIGRGINIGAFVLDDVTKSADIPYELGEVEGLKARLSNIFAPHFRLPLAGGRTINLSTILERSRDASNSQPLLELFGEKI